MWQCMNLVTGSHRIVTCASGCLFLKYHPPNGIPYDIYPVMFPESSRLSFGSGFLIDVT